MTSIDWQHSYLEAKETDLTVGDVEERELWDISDLDDFGIGLVLGDCGRMGESIDFGEWVKRHRGRLSK